MFVGGLAPLASSTPATDGNPDLPSVCGLDVTLILDNSNSIDATEQNQVRSAAETFADALVGTPSRVKVGVFATDSEGINAAGTHTPVLNNIVFRDPASYTDPITGAGRGGTNWDDGLEIARRSNGGPGDLVVFITDGDPTYRNEVAPDGHEDDGSTATDGDGNTVSTDNVNAAVYEADAIKASGAHMFGIGVGLTTASQEQRLNDVTGDEELTLDGSGNPNIPFGTADYTIAPDFTKLQAVINAFVRDLCAPSVNVTKILQKADGTTVQAGAGNPWQFTIGVDPTPTSWQTPANGNGASASQTTDASGGVSFKWEGPGNSATVDISETPQAGWVYNGAHCTLNGLDGNPPTEVLNTVGTNNPNQSKDISELQDLQFSNEKALNCDVYNREIRGSSLAVAKHTVPAGLPDEFGFVVERDAAFYGVGTLADGDNFSYSNVPTGTFAVTESPNPNFTLTASSCDNLATQQNENASPGQFAIGEAQSWKCDFTNTAKPGSITVVKNAIGADGTFEFTSNVPNLGNFDLTTDNGTKSTAKTSAAVGTYSIAESNPAPWTLTSSTCTGQQSPNQVYVGPGQDVTCTFTNTAPDPTIVVTKTAGVASVAEPGGPVTYTVKVQNTSVEDLTLTELTDSIDGGADIDITTVAAPITATTCATGGTIAAGATYQCTFTATVTGDGGDTVADEVTATALDSDDNEATDSDDASVDVTTVAPTIAVTKTPSVSSIAEPGGPITYTVKVTNTGVEDLTIDSIKDSIEGGSAFDATVVAPPVTATTCNTLIGDTLAPGADASCTFTTSNVVNLADLPDGDIDDTVTVEAHDDDGKVSGQASAEVTVTDSKPTIQITKTPSPTSVAETAPGQTRPVTYTVTIQNTSPEAVTIDSIQDSVEGGAAADVGGTCAALVGTTLAAGAGTNCTFTMGVAGNEGDSVHDTVTVGASDDDGNDTSDQDSAVVDITGLPSSITVTKTATPSSVAEPGAQVSFALVITNTSASDKVTLDAILDSVEGGAAFAAGGTCAGLLGTVLDPGGVANCSFLLDVNGNAGDTVDDVVTVNGTDDDGNAVSDDAPESVDITDVPSSLAVAKTADVASVPEPGGPVSYTVDITNTSPADSVTITTITDSVEGGAATAAGGTCPALIGTVLPPSGTASCSFTLNVSGNAGDAVDDVVVVSGVDDDDDPVQAQGSEVVDITDVAAAISVTKTPAPSSVPEPGADVTYTLEISNDSAADIVEIDSIVDSVDGGAPFDVAGTCDDLIGTDLAPGASTSCAFTLAVTGNAGDSVHDTVTVGAHDDDPVITFAGAEAPAEGIQAAAPNSLTASASAVVDITDVPPTGTASKTADPPSVPEPGGSVEFHVTATNTSAVEAATVTAITDTIDGNVIDVTTVGGPITATDCATGAVLAPGASYTCTFTLLISGADAGDSLVDEIGITLSDDDGNSVTPKDTETVTVTDVLPTITVSKDNGDASLPAPGGDVEFDVVVTNTSPHESVTLTKLTDTIEGGAPFDITVTDAPVVSTTCATGGVIPAGGTYSCSFTVAVESAEAATEADVVDATAVDNEGNPATAGDGAVTEVTASADLAIDKTLTGDKLTVGEPGEYQLEVSNLGPSTAAAPVVVDTLPEGLTATSATGDGWACAIAEQVVTCNRESLAPDESSVITIGVEVDESAADNEVTNVADVSSDTDDPDPENNHDEVTTVPIKVIPENEETTTTTAPPAEQPAVVDNGTLPRTGSEPTPLIAFGLCLVGLGGIVLLTRRARLAGRR